MGKDWAEIFRIIVSIYTMVLAGSAPGWLDVLPCSMFECLRCSPVWSIHNSCLQLCEVGGVLQQISNKGEYNEYDGRAVLCQRSSVSIKCHYIHPTPHLVWVLALEGGGSHPDSSVTEHFKILHIHSSLSHILNEVSNVIGFSVTMTLPSHVGYWWKAPDS